ncbi:MAG: YihY/virulence factor BrkB family protein [Geminicoccaceae bacterium]
MSEPATHATTTGRAARRPSHFGLADWKAILLRVYAQIGKDHLSIIAAGIAFYAMLALVPAITAAFGLYGLFADPGQIAGQIAGLRSVIPQDAYTIIEQQMTALAGTGNRTLGVTSLLAILFALWTSRAGVAALMQGLNIVYDEKEERGIIASLAVSLLLTVLVIAVGIAALTAIVVLPAVIGFLHLGATIDRLLLLLRWPILLGTMVLVIGILYRYGPNRANAKLSWVSPGAVCATLIWLAASIAFSIYVAEFSSYNKTYGTLGAIIILLMWMYISSFVILLGGELNAEMELHTARDTTTGPEQPMGERGAYVADNVV